MSVATMIDVLQFTLACLTAGTCIRGFTCLVWLQRSRQQQNRLSFAANL